jgi:hypothetical protein
LDQFERSCSAKDLVEEHHVSARFIPSPIPAGTPQNLDPRITSCASSKIDCGTVKRSALAVRTFKAIWKLAGARTGGLVGLTQFVIDCPAGSNSPLQPRR